MSKPSSFNCPTCQKVISWSDDFPHRPFCSARCKQIDFGDWATERFSIVGEPAGLEDIAEDKSQH